MSTRDDEELWLDDAAGPLIRPYTVSNGRTRPTVDLDLLSLMIATGREHEPLGQEHAQAVELCRTPISVAEVAAHLRLPVVVAKILLSDLVDCDALAVRARAQAADPTDQALLEKLLDGLQQRL
jgi:hypothetical protein